MQVVVARREAGQTRKPRKSDSA